MISKTLRVAPLVFSLFLIAACDSSEERAEKHFQSGLELLESGEVARAMVEFRNTLSLDTSHREARLIYARESRMAGNIAESYSNYLRLAERFPDDMEARLALTEMAILNLNWPEAERHGAALIESNAEIEGRDVVELALAFRTAILAEDNAKMAEITRQAETLFDAQPDDPILHRILIEGYSAEGRFEDAITVTDRALEADPNNRLFYDVKTGLLARLGDMSELGIHLRRVVEVFPDDRDAKTELVRMLVSQGDIAGAEKTLRDDIETSDDKVTAHIALVSFIRELKGPEAAIEEIDTALGLYENAPLLTALKAGILFDLQRRDEAVTLMQSAVDGAEPSDENDRLKIALARMLEATGNEVGARQLVESVLERDAGQVDALKMTAKWLIDGDQADDAINTLRRALDQEPEDAEAMTLMARAHDRNGEKQLAQDLLALAAEASDYAPAETLRFASLLFQQERYSSAEDVLVNSLRNSPQNVQVLTLLGRVYLANEDWSRAQQVENTLRSLDGPNAQLSADDLRLQLLARRQGSESGIAFLEELAENSDDIAPKIALIRATLASEDNKEEALGMAQELVAEEPGNIQAMLVLGSTNFALQNFEEAEAAFRKVLEIEDNPIAAMQLVRSVGAQGRSDEVAAIIDEMLARMPDSSDLLWAKASVLERQQDVDGAIAIYEELYAQDSNSPVIANNLASLLATYRDDEESLERAFAVGRRLRETTVPPFQDTYGWLLYRRGEFAEALTYLEPAANALSNDPIVIYHLGKTYAALGRDEDALRAFETALQIAGDADPRQQFADARAEIERISSGSGGSE